MHAHVRYNVRGRCALHLGMPRMRSNFKRGIKEHVTCTFSLKETLLGWETEKGEGGNYQKLFDQHKETDHLDMTDTDSYIHILHSIKPTQIHRKLSLSHYIHV